VFLGQFGEAALYSAETINNDGSVNTCEYSDFLQRMSDGGKNENQLKQIRRFIQKFVNETGVLEDDLKSEGSGFYRLPPHWFRFRESKGEKDWGLRLYCLMVSPKILILFNGGLKTHQNPKKCNNCKEHYMFAQAFTNAFLDAKVKGDIEIEDYSIKADSGFYLNVNV
jgi:hypothetical protein